MPITTPNHPTCICVHFSYLFMTFVSTFNHNMVMVGMSRVFEKLFVVGSAAEDENEIIISRNTSGERIGAKGGDIIFIF